VNHTNTRPAAAGLAESFASAEDYLAAGGGDAAAAALRGDPDAIVAEVKRSGLRGRGGAGFPTGTKWASIRAHPCPTKYLVCNAAEGEPGTFKDRWLLRRNPYLVIEGITIAAHAIGAAGAFIVIKRSFTTEISAVRRAIAELSEQDRLGPVPIQLVLGPEEYLLGEEKACVEVIEGAEPLPRILPPYQVGLFARPGSPNPAVTNNVETLANVVAIVRDGAVAFRTRGTESSPGTMLFTVCGDVRRPGVYELPLGTPLAELVHGHGGGPYPGARVKAVFPGASNTVLTAEQLDTPLDFDAMAQAGCGLGSGGFVVYDNTACIVAATYAFSRFLAVESCAQCPACKHGAQEITECLERIESGEGTGDDVDIALAKCKKVTGGQRCALPTGEALLVGSAVRRFRDEFDTHVGRSCPSPRDLPIPLLADFDEDAGNFRYDLRHRRKRMDWTLSGRR
jgi:NADH-quinone oxidoreductase subunit F